MIRKFYYYVGKLLEKKNKWEWAIKSYLKAQDDNNAMSNYRLAFCYEKRKDYGNAIYYYKKALKLEQTKVHWYFHLANSYMGIKKEELAAKYLKRGLSLDPKNKKNRKKYQKIRQNINYGIPEIDIFITNIKQSPNTIKLEIKGHIDDIHTNKTIKLEIHTRKNPLNIQASPLHINPSKVDIAHDNLFTAIFEIDFSTFTTSDIIVSNIWDFNLITDKKTRIKYFEKANHTFHHNNFDFIPYKTNKNTFSLVTVRKKALISAKKNKHVSLVIPRIDFSTTTMNNIIELGNILVSLDCEVTLIALDLVALPNKLPISQKINIDYVSTSLHRETIESFNFNSSKTKLPLDYDKHIKEYFSTLETDLIYSPVFGAPFLNSILSSLPKNIIKVIGEYSEKRYKIYNTYLAKNEMPTLSEIIKKTKDLHLFENLDKIDALHIIDPEVKKLFQQMTDTTIFEASMEKISLGSLAQKISDFIDEKHI